MSPQDLKQMKDVILETVREVVDPRFNTLEGKVDHLADIQQTHTEALTQLAVNILKIKKDQNQQARVIKMKKFG